MFKTLLTGSILILSGVAYGQSDSASYFLQKGLTEKTNGRRLESLKQFEKAYSYNKTDKQVVSELAAAYLDLRRYGQARESFIQLEKMGDKSDSTFRQLMILSYNLRQFDDAIKYASLLKTNYPSEKTAYYLTKSFYAKDDLGSTIKYAGFAAKENPDNAEIPYTVARAYADMYNYKAAIPHFQKAIELNPKEPRWIYEMALVYYAIPDDENSLKYILEAGEKGYKKDNEYMMNLATAYLNNKKLNEGIGILEGMLQRRPGDISLLNSIAEAYYDAKNYDDAIKYYDQLLAIDEKNAEPLYMIGMCFQKKGDKQKGMAMCDKAIQMDPKLGSLKQEKKMPGGGF